MSIKFFGKEYTKSIGVSNPITCPVCKEKTELSMFECIDASALAMLLGKPVEENFAICPKCAAVLRVNPDYINTRKKGTVCYLQDSDVTENA